MASYLAVDRSDDCYQQAMLGLGSGPISDRHFEIVAGPSVNESDVLRQRIDWDPHITTSRGLAMCSLLL